MRKLLYEKITSLETWRDLCDREDDIAIFLSQNHGEGAKTLLDKSDRK
jgi:hypothetical protein